MDYLGKTDEEIALLVQRGEAEAFGTLVDRYEDKIKRYARKFISDREDAKDLVQEVFMKAYANIQSFDPNRRFSPWIYRIAHNEFVNALKRKLSEKFFPFDFDVIFPHPVAKETADSQTQRKELKQLLDKHLGQLAPKYREPLVLYYFQDLNYKEIAEVLRIPVSTVGVRINRGKIMMRNFLENLEMTPKEYGK